MDNDSSNRLSRRIASNNSTFDLTIPAHLQALDDTVVATMKVGPNQTAITSPACREVGPNQTVTTRQHQHQVEPNRCFGFEGGVWGSGGLRGRVVSGDGTGVLSVSVSTKKHTPRKDPCGNRPYPSLRNPGGTA